MEQAKPSMLVCIQGGQSARGFRGGREAMDKVLSCAAKRQRWEGYSKGPDLLPLALYPANPSRIVRRKIPIVQERPETMG